MNRIVRELKPKNSHDLISVIVPVYNVENYLNKCVESIVTQTYKELEIILINDGSSDKSGIVCDGWALKDNRIRVIHKSNGGLSDARNTGLDIATGEYIVFVDSDDYIDSEMYEKLWTVLKKNGADLAICGFNQVTDKGDPLEICGLELKDGIIDKKEVLKGIIHSGSNCVAWNKMYHSRLFDCIRFPLGKYYEDRMVMPLIIERSNRIVATSETLYNYRLSSNSITRSNPNIKWFDDVEGFYCNLKFFESRNYQELACETAVKLIDKYLIVRNKVGIIPSTEKDRLREIKKMVRFCYLKYRKQIRFLHVLNIECPALYTFLFRMKRKFIHC